MSKTLSLSEEKKCLAQVLWPSHEPLRFMRRRGGIPLDYARYYRDYHKPANVRLWAKLLGPGGMLRLHFFKGMGLKAEREEIERSIRVARIMKKEGLRVSVYVGGTMHTDSFFKEVPESRNWVTEDTFGRPITYQGYQLWRYFPCINHPAYRRYLFKVLDAALDEVGADEIFFDNQILRAEPRSCRCKVCRKKFPEYVAGKYSEKQRLERFGHPDVSGITPPLWSDAWPPSRIREIKNPVIQEWIAFRCHTVHDFFLTMKTYIQKRRPATSVGINIKGLHAHNICFNNGIDHGRFQEAGFNCCDAGLYAAVGPHENLLAEFRAYKITHTTGLSQSGQHGERDNLLCLVMNKQLDVPGFGRRPDLGNLRIFGRLRRFLREHEDEWFGTRPIIADAAVLRSFPSMAYHSNNWLYGPYLAEQGLWEAHVPFGIIFDQNMDRLSDYKVLFLANQDALSNRNVARIKRFVQGGGGLLATGNSGAYDDWRRVRTRNALGEAFGLKMNGRAERKKVGRGRVAYLPRLVPKVKYAEDLNRHPHGKHEDAAAPANWADVQRALCWAAGGRFRFEVSAPLGVAVEYRQGPRPGDRVVHLMNFRDAPIRGTIRVVMATQAGERWALSVQSPERLPAEAPVLAKGRGSVSFSLPGLGLYTACVLRRV